MLQEEKKKQTSKVPTTYYNIRQWSKMDVMKLPEYHDTDPLVSHWVMMHKLGFDYKMVAPQSKMAVIVVSSLTKKDSPFWQ